jgi:BASS family bile acid:Na+ symporter
MTKALSDFVHERFLWFLVLTYILAAFFPSAGTAMRKFSFLGVSLPAAMLSLLLFNAGLGVELADLKGLWRQPSGFLLGLTANLLVPIAFIFCVSPLLSLWSDAEQGQSILVGLALVASMPVAGSSAAWAQNANGDVALSLGLVLFSTLLSPVTTPAALHWVSWVAEGEYVSDLHRLAARGTGIFLVVYVLLPSLAGIITRIVLGAQLVKRIKPQVKLANSVTLLVLNYANASASLPYAVANPAADFLCVTLAIVTVLCVIAFFTGWAISTACGFDRAERASLMFALGMNNNGTALVLAAMALADRPLVMLPIIFYNLVQHLVAGGVDRVLCREPEAGPVDALAA